MKSIILSLVTTLLVIPFLHAQPVNITINGMLEGLKDGTKVFLVPDATSGFPGWRDSTVAKDGKFRFNSRFPEAWKYTIRTSRDFAPGQWTDLYFEEGTINIKGKIAESEKWEITGSPFARDQGAYNKFLAQKGIVQLKEELRKTRREAEEKNDATTGKKAFEQFKMIDSLQFLYAKEWIKAHPASVISTYLLWDYHPKFTPVQLEDWLNELSPTAKNTVLGRDMQARIDAPKLTAIGKTAPSFTQNDTSGTAVSLTGFRGKYVLLDFWASWCGPCRAETPDIIPLYNKYKDGAFTIISISIDDKRQAWTQAIIKDKMPWTQISDLKGWQNSIAKLYGVSAVPHNLLLDPQGKIIARNLHGKDLENKLAEVLN
ncbi:MAG: TlpA disulfide reductase family protein [Chitinophagaceae bacterium]